MANFLFSDTKLEGLSEKIFLDRYASKELDKTKWQINKKVVALLSEDPSNALLRKSVTATLLDINLTHNRAIVEDVSDKSTHEVSLDNIEYPKEQHPAELWERVARSLASVELPEKQQEIYEQFAYAVNEWKLVPGGRVNAGAGTDELTLMNCFVIPNPHDSRKGIMNTLTEMTEIMSRGGGVGINLSSLRPKRSTVVGVNGHSSGAVSWGGLYSYTTGLIEQGGSRRGALMLMINDWHPDLMNFIKAKSEMGLITNANMSVCVSNGFMNAIKEDLDWTTEFPITSHPAYDVEWKGNIRDWKAKGYPVKTFWTMKAREIWDVIIESAWKSAEPGIWFDEYTNDMSNSYYFNPLICTNPCGEQSLPAWGVCNLSAINLSKFYDETKHDVDWYELKKITRIGVRLCDNVSIYTMYPLEQQRLNQLDERRTGLGTMGLAELLIKLNIRYGSQESLVFLDKLYGFMAIEAYKASIDLAEEKGMFGKCEPHKMAQSGFMKQMLPELRKHSKMDVWGNSKYSNYAEKFLIVGIRNVTIITQAPTGSTGTMVGTSTGVEPYFAFEYMRKGRLGSHIEHVAIAKEWIVANRNQKLPEYYTTSQDLSAEDHVRIQAVIQKWTDSSISKTANCPNEFTVSETKKLYELAFDLGCKGVTIYRDGSRDIQVLNTIKEVEKEAPQGMELAELTLNTEDFVSGKTCEIRYEDGQRIVDCGTE
jgi:ribonucleoside-diphosphate reductase alpha chain